MIYRLAFIALLLGLTGCGGSLVARYAYVYPVQGKYVVKLAGNGVQDDTLLSEPLSLEDAHKLADQINNDMAGKWSAGKE